ncbi:MAG TPA: ankyrin repeat domain-containing protein [Candidatus Thermoplasmatota archaeon]|nr:ankyrin repeat domain-containing protein [Candidatus Thermoplasmatota archaeon]
MSNTALFEALKSRDLARVKAALDDGADLQVRSPEGWTPLLFAIYMRLPEAVTLLQQRGAKPDIFEAAALDHAELVRGYLAENASLANALNADGGTALHLAAHYGQQEAAQVLLAAGANPNLRQRSPFGPGNTPLHAAAAGMQVKMFPLLKRAGADVNATDDGGHTPLMIAAANGSVEAVQWLLPNGADPSIKSKAGKTAVDFAVDRGHGAVVALFPSLTS